MMNTSFDYIEPVKSNEWNFEFPVKVNRDANYKIDVNKTSDAYIEAKRLLKLLQYFVELDDLSDIPPTAIIREFIGGSKIVH